VEVAEEVDVEANEEADIEAKAIRVDTRLDAVESERELGTRSRRHNLAFITSVNINNVLPRMSVVPVPGSSFYRFMLLLGTVAKPKLALQTLNHRGSVQGGGRWN
jgi:hypothetical protein